MSRIIVKGLPKYLTEQRLREHFASKGDVTDVKLMKKPNGESRRFAFVGYKSDEAAEQAVQYFNGSYIDTAKIDVQVAKSFADPTVPQSMKEKRREAYHRLKEREREIEEARKLKKQKVERETIDKEIEKNQQLQEFIETMKPAAQSKSWANDAVVNTEGAPSNSLLAQALALKGDEQADDSFKFEEESDDEYADFGLKKEPEQEEPEEKMMSLNDVKDDNLAVDESVSDFDWLKQRRIRIREGEDPEEKPAAEAMDVDTAQEVADEAAEEAAEEAVEEVAEPDSEEVTIQKIQETGRLFLRNILYSATEEEFTKLFGKFGDLEEVHIAVDTRTGESKGFAYIKFVNNDDAVRAYIELDKQIFQGRLLHILPAAPKKDHRLDEFDLKNLPLKKQRELKRKNDAAKTQFSWNSLYMNQDAVLSSVASKLGVDKRDLIDPESSNAAVKQALAEAHVIGDVRKFFESKGVDLTSFEGKQRDDKVILIKNFPHGTTQDEIAELFTPFGELKRFLMPPSGTIAIIEFRDAPSARAAFSKLSYRRFKKGILYLEKGPAGLFTREPEAGDSVAATEVKEEIKEIPVAHEQHVEESDVPEGPTVSIFVKNLNFSTTSAALTSRFKAFDGFVVAQVKTKPNPKDSTKTLSMGFGFVEYRSKEQAQAVISALDGSVIDGHRIQLKLSHRQGSSQPQKSSKSAGAKSAKILVKNLPFEATRKDVLELFSSFGQLKSVRVPRKFDKTARGFAFIEFLLPKEAENAMDQLQGVHLLGRRLVMQYAEKDAEDAEETIARMTKKVKKQVATRELAEARAGGKRKLDIEEDAEEEF